MIMLLLTIIIFSLLIFKNSLYFTISLLFISISTLSYLCLNTYLNTLTGLILVIVYVGAIIILIGYICAIRPNLILEPDYSSLFLVFIFLILTFFLNKTYSNVFNSTHLSLVDFFYSFQGFFLFFSLIFILFITLLIVTTQYSVPKGPFRSI
jgi:hypothetical protein